MAPISKEHQVQLHILKNATPKNRKQIVAHASPALIKTISEIALNVLKGSVPLTKAQKNKLRKYKNLLRKLGGTKKLSIKKRRQLIQRGGQLLPLILGPLFSSVIPLVVKGVKKLFHRGKKQKK